MHKTILLTGALHVQGAIMQTDKGWYLGASESLAQIGKQSFCKIRTLPQSRHFERQMLLELRTHCKPQSHLQVACCTRHTMRLFYSVFRDDVGQRVMFFLFHVVFGESFAVRYALLPEPSTVQFAILKESSMGLRMKKVTPLVHIPLHSVLHYQSCLTSAQKLLSLKRNLKSPIRPF